MVISLLVPKIFKGGGHLGHMPPSEGVFIRNSSSIDPVVSVTILKLTEDGPTESLVYYQLTSKSSAHVS